MSRNQERTQYAVAYEEGDLVRRGKTRIRGREVKLYTNYSRFPREVRGEIATRLLVEIAQATNSDPESVRQQLMDNYNAATKKASDNAYRGDYTPVPVEPIRYTRDPRRRAIQIAKAPILSSQN